MEICVTEKNVYIEIMGKVPAMHKLHDIAKSMWTPERQCSLPGAYRTSHSKTMRNDMEYGLQSVHPVQL